MAATVVWRTVAVAAATLVCWLLDRRVARNQWTCTCSPSKVPDRLKHPLSIPRFEGEWRCGCFAGTNSRDTRNLYVGELCPSVMNVPAFRSRNLRYKGTKPCAYVGETAHTPSCRWKQHRCNRLAGRKYATRYGKSLMPEHFEHLNPVPANEAKEKEAELAKSLQERGWGVWSN